MQACIGLILNWPTAGGGFSFFAAVPEASGFFAGAKWWRCAGHNKSETARRNAPGCGLCLAWQQEGGFSFFAAVPEGGGFLSMQSDGAVRDTINTGQRGETRRPVVCALPGGRGGRLQLFCRCAWGRRFFVDAKWWRCAGHNKSGTARRNAPGCGLCLARRQGGGEGFSLGPAKRPQQWRECERPLRAGR